mgnify:CR=1 FL=1
MGAVRKRDLSYFSFFLHHFEKQLNGVIYRFLTRNGYDRYDPARFLDYKLEVLQMLLYCLPKFDPEQETEFLKRAVMMAAGRNACRQSLNVLNEESVRQKCADAMAAAMAPAGRRRL